MYKQRWQSRIFLIIGLITSVMTHSTTTPALNPHHPNSYIMKEGDTLWDISSIFLEDQWLWPEIWRAYPQLQNPHLIYPGDSIHFLSDSKSNHQPYLKLIRSNTTNHSVVLNNPPNDAIKSNHRPLPMQAWSPLLFIKGQLKALQRQPCIAFVGARKCTRLGENNCYQLSLQCANLGFVIVSGLAYGIDSHAHRACLNSNSASPTLAVLANGLDKIYPPQHQAMAEQILSEGALISEYIPGTQPLPQHFPQRNRIISGLCIAVVVIEAARKSGSLITARLSMEQGREVFCVPGPINNPLNQGGHDLIQQGAKLITCTEDILEEFTEYTHLANPQKTAMKQSENIAKYPDRLLELFDYTPISVDELIKKSGLTPEKVSSMLVTLEMAGRVICDINGLYSRSTTDGK